MDSTRQQEPKSDDGGLPPLVRRSASSNNSRAASPALGTRTLFERPMSIRQELPARSESPVLMGGSRTPQTASPLQKSVDRLAMRLEDASNCRRAASPVLKNRILSGRTTPDMPSPALRPIHASLEPSATCVNSSQAPAVEWSLDAGPVERPPELRRKATVERTPETSTRSIAAIVDALTPGMRRAAIQASSDIRAAAQAVDHAMDQPIQLNHSRVPSLSRSRRNSVTAGTLEPLRSSTPVHMSQQLQQHQHADDSTSLIDLEDEERLAKKNRRQPMAGPSFGLRDLSPPVMVEADLVDVAQLAGVGGGGRRCQSRLASSWPSASASSVRSI